MEDTDGYIENRTFDEIGIGATASLTRKLTRHDIELFAAMSGDVNPAMVDPEYASSDMFHKIIAHGMWGGALISTVLGTELPGPGTIYLDQSLAFRAPVSPGDTVTVTVTAREKDEKNHHVRFDCTCTNQDGKVVIDGSALVIAPTEKIRRKRVELPEVRLEERGDKFRRMTAMAEKLEPIRTAVVHPVDANSLGGAVAAAKANLIIPVLIGPEHKIRAAAEEAGIDIEPYQLVPTEHSDAAAARAVAMARKGEVGALMKGSLHTDEFLHPVVQGETGLRTERRMSHVFVLDIPTFDRPLFVTDGAINIYPDLATKKDIVQNAIDLALALDIKQPRVAVLSAVEVVEPKIRSTVEAAAICKMANRNQITGGIVDGPLAFDNAISTEAARAKGIESAVAGRSDILVAPDLEAGNMLAKQLEYLADAEAAGIVVGARLPIMLTSRADSVQSRQATCAVAALMHRHRRRQ
ncbi:MAG: bifunctional enoyl-CoA hydratase/phosphate acetyltransferase [Gammaproteobacteria bacterium]|jgi:phosphate acetyltransferase